LLIFFSFWLLLVRLEKMLVAKGLQSTKPATSVCVHDGVFHLDEVTAVAMLSFIYDVTVTRSRDPAVWAKDGYLVDVGGMFDAGSGYFDHHQRGFGETMKSLRVGQFVTKLSSAGLIYAHYGKQIISAISPELNTEQVEEVYQRVYAKFIEPIDANDNGIARHEGQLPEPKFDNGFTTLPAIISLYNFWDVNCSSQDDQFMEAVALLRNIFKKIVDDVVRVWLPAVAIVTQAATSALVENKPYILMQGFYPVQEIVEKMPGNESLLYVITQDKEKDQFVVKCLGKQGLAFVNRKSLVEEWRGLSGPALDEAIQNTKLAQGTGHLPHTTGAVFVHAAGFIGAHKTLDGVIGMAMMSARA
jgi:uncharacterized UPF0160 family protein